MNHTASRNDRPATAPRLRRGAAGPPLLLLAILAWTPAAAPASVPSALVERVLLRLPSGARLDDPGVERTLRSAGLTPLRRLDEGLPASPPDWARIYVARLTPARTRADLGALAAALSARVPALELSAEARYEALVAPGFDWGGGAAGPLAPLSRPTLAPRNGGPGFFPDDPLFADGTQWGLHNDGTGPFGGVAGFDIGAPEAWATTAGRTDVIVGLVDTGIDPGHPDLNPTLPDGSPRLIALDKGFPGGEPGADSVGHGTMVCGVMAAVSNNGALLDGRGVAGTIGGTGADSTGARLVSIKATIGRFTIALGSDLARSIVMAHGYGARVINVSFGGDEPSAQVRNAIAFVQGRGTTVVIGAGNGADARLQYPGAYARFGIGVSVGAITPDGTLAVFSSRGEQLDVVAPGEDIWSTYVTYENAFGSPNRNYLGTSGTSFSAPFVSGLAGLALSLDADLRENDFQEILRRTARDLGSPGRDNLFGRGLVDAPAVLAGLSPPRGLLHDLARAQTWRFIGRESLAVVNSGLTRAGFNLDGNYEAEVWEVTSAVTSVDRFLEPPQVWVRPAGNGGWSRGRMHEFNFAAGEVVPGTVNDRTFAVRTWVYFIEAPPERCTECPPVGWLPRPPEEVQIAWTAWARLDAPPTLRVVEPAPGAFWRPDRPERVIWEAEDPDEVSRVEVHWVPEGLPAFPTLVATSAAPAGTTQVRVPCLAGVSTGTLRVIARDERGHQVDQVVEEVPIELETVDCFTGPVQFAAPRPNPAMGTARFEYWLPRAAGTDASATIRVRLYDPRGRLVRVLLETEGAEPGAGTAVWDGRDDDGRPARSGVYFAEFTSPGTRIVRRFVYLRR